MSSICWNRIAAMVTVLAWISCTLSLATAADDRVPDDVVEEGVPSC